MSGSDVVGQLKSTGGEMGIEWEIVDFLSLPADVGKCYDSPTFFYCDSSWYISVYPNGHKAHSSEGFIGMYLDRGDLGPPVSVTWSLFIKKTEGRKEVVNEDKKTFKVESKSWGRPKVMQRSELVESESEFLPTGILTLVCTLKCDGTRGFRGDEAVRRAMKDCITSAEVSTQTEADFADEVPTSAMKECISSAEASTETEADVGTEKLLSDLEGLVISGDESDVTVRVQEEEFRLHRAILAARTPVFNSMFKHNMKEKATGVVSVDDFEAGTFRIFVHYLYTGSTDQLTPENMINLYKMADKYQVQELKASCLDIMKRTLCVDTFCDIADLAMKYDEGNLMEEATVFLSENTVEIIGTKEWCTLLRNNIIEVNKLLKEALIRK